MAGEVDDLVPRGDAPTLRVSYDAKGARMELEVARESIRAGLFPALGKPRTLGRYHLLRRIGDGGMGLILAAHDPELDREIAIKIVRPQSDNEDPADHQRLLAEARTAARLSHPNVVAVHDVGLHEGRVFVAMELVRGASLRRWLLDRHDLTEILQVMVQAGRGLAAAHDAGLVHRDFKPGNVLVGDDGRVRVVDFGLARSTTMEAMDTQPSLRGEGAMSTRHTASGVMAGTPAYMAPEQWIGGSIDGRADQFSFCLCLYEALFGMRPFPGETLGEIRDAVLGAPLRFPASATDLPVALRQALERGLSRRREDRYPDMHQLLSVLAGCLPPEVLEDAEASSVRSVTKAAMFRVDEYLGELPRGLDSHPQCLVDSGLVRLALSRMPIDHPLVAQLDGRAASNDGWIPEVHARAMMAALFDQHFDSLERFGELLHHLLRARMTTVFIGFLLPTATSARAPEAMPRVWRALHKGTTLTLLSSSQGFARVELHHPPGLLDELGRLELEQTLVVAMECAGARLVEVHARGWTKESTELDARWG